MMLISHDMIVVISLEYVISDSIVTKPLKSTDCFWYDCVFRITGRVLECINEQQNMNMIRHYHIIHKLDMCRTIDGLNLLVDDDTNISQTHDRSLIFRVFNYLSE